MALGYNHRDAMDVITKFWLPLISVFGMGLLLHYCSQNIDYATEILSGPANMELPSQNNKHHLNSYNVCTKGHPGFTHEWLRSEFGHFVAVYDKRPRIVNSCGTMMTHQFAIWAMVR